MLRTMRNDFKKYSWTLWLVIIAFLLGFSFTDIFSGGDKSETVIAQVGEQEINVESYQKQLFQVLDNYKNQMKGNFSKDLITQMRVPEQILQNLINSRIIQNEAESLNLRATERELKQMIVNFPAFQKDGKFVGISEYKRYLAIFRTNAKDFESDLKKDIINDKLKEIVTASLVVDHSGLKEEFKKENDSAEVDYVTLSLTSDRSGFQATDGELKNYFEANRDDFRTPEKRRGHVIALKYDDFKKDLKLTEKDYYDYFRANKEQFQTPERNRIFRLFINYDAAEREDVLKKIQGLKTNLNTENFESMAREHSTDSKKESGGDWGYTEWRSFTSQEQSIIKSLKQNEISDPVDTLSGFSILYAKEKTAESQEPYETAQPKIKNILEKEQLRTLVTSRLDKLYKRVKGADDISAIKDDSPLKPVDTGFIASGEAVKDVEQFGYLSRKLFTMNEKEISYPVEYMEGIAIVQLTAVREPENDTFENVKEEVREIVVSQKQMEDLISKSDDIPVSLNNLTDEEKIQDFLKTRDLKMETVNYKRGNELSSLGNKEGLDEMIFTGEEGKFTKPFILGDNVVFLRAKNIKISTDSDFEREKAEFYGKKLKEIKDNYFVSYIITKRSQYKVGINQELYDKVREAVVSRFN